MGILLAGERLQDSGGGSLTNFDNLVELGNAIQHLESRGIFVEFWQVGREDNTEADHLAQMGC
jgi:hypothetical protein